ncbi:hypothetical protein M2352_005090 [Azospirillum fermentarium]|uniref:hypothetical protein n=1 Tax=Azospirillum fermentarium TaxID=1233114 RepID=UPI002226BB4A|nr:hypothetical protein [Azospirillum fermentarium]MCW2249430.1 hypothetical protein [Azospirillum fermentarium]
METSRSASVKLLAGDLRMAAYQSLGFPDATVQTYWDDLLGFIGAHYRLKGGVPDTAWVAAVRNRLLASNGAALESLDGHDDHGFVLGLLVWLIRDCRVPYDHSLSLVRQPGLVHLETYRVWAQFRHLQAAGRISE